jgi:hypothetical protein
MGAKPVPLASRIKGLVLSSRRKKLPKGPSMRRMSRSFISPKTWSVNLAARHVAQVQFDGRRGAQLVRRVGHAVAAPRAIAQDELDILAGVVLQNLVGGQLQAQHDHVGCRSLQGQHTRRHLQHREFTRPRHAAGLQRAVALRRGATGQHQALRFFVGRQRLVLVGALLHAACEQAALAGAAGAVAAAIGQADALADGRSQQRLVGFCREAAARGLQGDGETHGGRKRESYGDRAGNGQGVARKLRSIVPYPMVQASTAARRPTLLIVGCGDVGQRVLRLLHAALARAGPDLVTRIAAVLRQQGAVPLLGNLDEPATLGRLGGLADAVLHLAPPPLRGDTDPRTRASDPRPGARRPGAALVYASTTGVYGDCGGRTLRRDPGRGPCHRPCTPPRRRRAQPACAGRRAGVRVAVLRVPGIYAGDRPGGHPRDRLQRGTPALCRADDVYTNHIHADDLARACVAALWRAGRNASSTSATTPRCDGRLLRPGRRPLRPAAPDAHHARRGRAAAEPDDDELHERIAPARQPPPEA